MPTVTVMAENRGWVVTASADRSLADIKRDLEAAGFSVHQVHEEIGSITGAATDDTAHKLRSIAGVVDVSPDTPIDIGPPDSRNTW
jgi:hypothetical protein